MIIMKKKYKIFLVISIIIILISLILLLNFTRDNNISFLTLKKHYSLIYNEYPEVEIHLYSSQSKSHYTKKDYMNTISIYNDDSLYKVNLETITNTKRIMYHNKEPYYEYILKLKFDLKSNDLIYIRNSKLQIKYSTEEILDVELGNICFSNNVTDNHFNVHKVQSIVNDFGTHESLVGVIMSLSTNYNCTIKNIKPISSSILINKEKIVVGNNLEYDHNELAVNIFGSDFNSFKYSTNTFSDITFNKNIKKDVAIPLCYIEKEYVDNIGFIIEYVIENITYYQIINPYKLFNTPNIGFFINEYRLSTN